MLSSQSLESLPCLHNKVRHQILASSLLRYIQNLAPSCDLWCHHLYPCHCLLTWTTAAGSWLGSWLILLPFVGPLVFFSLFRILESHSHFINGKMKVLSINCVIWLFSASLIPFPTFSPHLLCFSTLASLPFLEPFIRQLLQAFCISLCWERFSHRYVRFLCPHSFQIYVQILPHRRDSFDLSTYPSLQYILYAFSWSTSWLEWKLQRQELPCYCSRSYMQCPEQWLVHSRCSVKYLLSKWVILAVNCSWPLISDFSHTKVHPVI